MSELKTSIDGCISHIGEDMIECTLYGNPELITVGLPKELFSEIFYGMPITVSVDENGNGIVKRREIKKQYDPVLEELHELIDGLKE